MKPLVPILLLAGLSWRAHAQCTVAPIAAASCSGGNGAASSGLNINSGTYWVNSAATFSTLNMSGGTLRVCGNLTIQQFNLNSGNIVVEHGGILTISSWGGGATTTNLNGNVVFVNRGTIYITASMTFQNSGNYIINDLSTSDFVVAGKITVNSNGLTVANRGLMSISSLYYQGAAGGFCLAPLSSTSIFNLTNVTTNGFSYAGASSPACLSIGGSATLTNALTNSSSVHVCLGGTSSGAGGWGSAVVATGCSSCNVVLPLGIYDMTATRDATGVRLRWTSGPVPVLVPGDNGVYYAERSLDGVNFETFATVDADAFGVYTVSDPDVTASRIYYRVRAVSAGVMVYSAVALVETAVSGQFQIYPNPAESNTAVTLVVPAVGGGQGRFSLIDMAGRVLGVKMVTLTAGDNTSSWQMRGVAAGLYLVRIEMPGRILYARLVIRSN